MPDQRVAGWLGIDVGWVHPAADSDGRIYSWSSRKQRWEANQSHARAGDVTITRPDGTVTVRPAYNSDELVALVLTDPVELRHRCHLLASRIVAKAFGMCYGIALESWVDDPQRDTRWRVMHQEIINRCVKRNVPWLTVKKAYTSQTCPSCGHVDAANRPTRAKFKCVECGESGHTDHFAAITIASRAAAKRPPDLNMRPPGTLEKRCTGCLTVKSRAEFVKHKASKDGRVARCKECEKAASGWEPQERCPGGEGIRVSAESRRGTCPSCGSNVAVTNAGRVYGHKRAVRTAA